MHNHNASYILLGLLRLIYAIWGLRKRDLKFYHQSKTMFAKFVSLKHFYIKRNGRTVLYKIIVIVSHEKHYWKCSLVKIICFYSV